MQRACDDLRLCLTGSVTTINFYLTACGTNLSLVLKPGSTITRNSSAPAVVGAQERAQQWQIRFISLQRHLSKQMEHLCCLWQAESRGGGSGGIALALVALLSSIQFLEHEESHIPSLNHLCGVLAHRNIKFAGTGTAWHEQHMRKMRRNY